MCLEIWSTMLRGIHDLGGGRGTYSEPLQDSKIPVQPVWFTFFIKVTLDAEGLLYWFSYVVTVSIITSRMEWGMPTKRMRSSLRVRSVSLACKQRLCSFFLAVLQALNWDCYLREIRKRQSLVSSPLREKKTTEISHCCGKSTETRSTELSREFFRGLNSRNFQWVSTEDCSYASWLLTRLTAGTLSSCAFCTFTNSTAICCPDSTCLVIHKTELLGASTYLSFHISNPFRSIRYLLLKGNQLNPMLRTRPIKTKIATP